MMIPRLAGILSGSYPLCGLVKRKQTVGRRGRPHRPKRESYHPFPV